MNRIRAASISSCIFILSSLRDENNAGQERAKETAKTATNLARRLTKKSREAGPGYGGGLDRLHLNSAPDGQLKRVRFGGKKAPGRAEEAGSTGTVTEECAKSEEPFKYQVYAA